jgi:hypothetical protein
MVKRGTKEKIVEELLSAWVLLQIIIRNQHMLL